MVEKLDIVSKQLLNFSTLKQHAPKQVIKTMIDFIKHVQREFRSRFEDFSFPREILAFVSDPISELQLTELHPSAHRLSNYEIPLCVLAVLL